MVYGFTLKYLAYRARARARGTGSHIAETETIVAIPIYSMYLVHRSLQLAGQLAGPESPAAVSNSMVGAEKN